MANEEDLELERRPRIPSWLNLRWLFKVGGVVLLVGCSVGGTAFYFMMSYDRPMDVQEETDEPEFARGVGKAVYHGFRTPFVTAFEANERQRYFQVDVTLVTRNPELVGALGVHEPLLRNKLVMLFARQDYLELQTDEGRIRLRKDATAELRTVMSSEIGESTIESVIFTNFVMQ